MSNNIKLKEFQCQDGLLKGRKYKLPSTACVFCNHCTDLFWDFSHGIYALFCDKDIDYRSIYGNVKGECKMFEPEESEEIKE